MSPIVRIRTVSRARRIALVGALAASLAGTGLVTASIASAAVPTFPDNLVVFPDRDFVMVENYQTHVGQVATVKVTRAGAVVGSAQSVVNPGDVAFEVNHPGGVCWGTGPGAPQVTPDILPGDVVSISFGGVVVADTIVQDAAVTADSVLAGSTLTITGHIGAGVNQAQMEQRVVNPDLTAMIGRRDVRAVPGPMTPSDKGGYSSSLLFGADTFTATYVFDSAAVAQTVATGGGERAMNWQFEDAAANRQGLTIAEYGELGGPGFGGCPSGPLASGPAGPTNVAAVNVAGGVALTWIPAVAIPGTAAITGYRATAIARTVTGGEQVEIGRRIAGQAATGTTITGLSPTETYDIEVVSVSSVGETRPPVTAFPTGPAILRPTVTATPAGGAITVPQQVTLTSPTTGAQIFFTTDGSDPVQADAVNPSATLYTVPFTVSTNTTVKFVAFDPAGIVSLIGAQTYTFSAPTSAPVIGIPTAGNASAIVRWTAPANAASSAIATYSVTLVDAAGLPVGVPQVAASGATSLNFTGLVNGTAVRFQVRANNAVGPGPFSASSTAVTPSAPVVVTVAGAPTIKTASAGNASAIANWTPPASNGGSAILRYNVRVVDAATGITVIDQRDAVATATSLNFTGLDNGTAIRFQVLAINEVGTGAVSAHSNAVTPMTVPGRPAIGTATAGIASATGTWTATSNGGSAITKYHVRVVDAATGLKVYVLRDVDGSARSLTVGLARGLAVRFQVQAINAVGMGLVSAHSNGVIAR